MHRKLLALLLSALLALGCAACGGEEAPAPAETPSAAPSGAAGGAKGEASAAAQTVEATTLSVDRSTGALTVKRPSFDTGARMGDAGVWTIFVYLCGSDLESEAGSATDDLLEMLDGASGQSVRFVVETGGAIEWLNDQVDASCLQRYLIEDESLYLTDEQPAANMGEQKTLTDFLRWGVSEFASEHMGVVLWDHGGGSITGVCFDELNDNDSLTLRELDAALRDVCGGMTQKFDFVGFDACLMGTLETANVLASYADYLYGSQELEPGSGWDYAAIGSYLAGHAGADALSLGRVVCDSFVAACRALDDDDLCTLSVVDLSRLDALLVSFNDFARGMYEAGGDSTSLVSMVRGISAAENFGGNNRAEGYTNMVDLGGLISACADYADGADKALAALDAAVAYSASGATHASASGLSLYYPLSVQGSQELSVFGDICPSPYYISFVDRQNQSGVFGSDTHYSDDAWFGGGGWSWGEFDDTGYWEYLDAYEQTGESPLITFEIEPHLDEEGDFWFVLDDDGWYYAADVYALVYEISEDGQDLIELGETYDIDGDWETGFFCDVFDGWWLSLPDGQNLATYIVEDTPDYVIYTSPIRLNGVETNLRLRQNYEDGSVIIEGAWTGIDENGAAAREIVKLKDGDVILPLYYASDADTGEEFYYYGQEYTVAGTPEILYDVMEDGDYLFAFCIDDIYGDYYVTEPTLFNVEDGESYFYLD